jgi:hypothetical protein
MLDLCCQSIDHVLPPQPHPYKARHPHEYWFIDGRQMDFALDGVKWWSILVLEGYSRGSVTNHRKQES